MTIKRTAKQIEQGYPPGFFETKFESIRHLAEDAIVITWDEGRGPSARSRARVWFSLFNWAVGVLLDREKDVPMPMAEDSLLYLLEFINKEKDVPNFQAVFEKAMGKMKDSKLSQNG